MLDVARNPVETWNDFIFFGNWNDSFI